MRKLSDRAVQEAMKNFFVEVDPPYWGNPQISFTVDPKFMRLVSDQGKRIRRYAEVILSILDKNQPENSPWRANYQTVEYLGLGGYLGVTVLFPERFKLAPIIEFNRDGVICQEAMFGRYGIPLPMIDIPFAAFTIFDNPLPNGKPREYLSIEAEHLGFYGNLVERMTEIAEDAHIPGRMKYSVST